VLNNDVVYTSQHADKCCDEMLQFAVDLNAKYACKIGPSLSLFEK